MRGMKMEFWHGHMKAENIQICQKKEKKWQWEKNSTLYLNLWISISSKISTFILFLSFLLS